MPSISNDLIHKIFEVARYAVSVFLLIIVFFILQYIFNMHFECSCREGLHLNGVLYMILPPLILIFVVNIAEPFQRRTIFSSRCWLCCRDYQRTFCSYLLKMIIKYISLAAVWIAVVLFDGDWYICLMTNLNKNQTGIPCRKSLSFEEQLIVNGHKTHSLDYGLGVICGFLLLWSIVETRRVCCKSKDKCCGVRPYYDVVYEDLLAEQVSSHLNEELKNIAIQKAKAICKPYLEVIKKDELKEKNGADNQNDNGADNQNDNRADNQNDNGADNQNDNRADNQNDNGADNQNDNRADNQNDNIADNQNDNLADNQNDNRTDNQSNNGADNQNDNRADNQNDNIADNQNDNLADNQNDNLADNQSNNGADNQNDNLADNQNDNIADNQSNNGADNQSNNGADNQNDNLADNQNDNLADNQSNNGADNQNDNIADNQSNNGADNQSNNGADNQNDNIADNQSNNRADNQNDNRTDNVITISEAWEKISSSHFYLTECKEETQRMKTTGKETCQLRIEMTLSTD